MPVDLLRQLDVTNLIAMAAMFWFFYTRIDKKFDAVDKKFDEVNKKFDEVNKKFDEVNKKFDDVNKRIDSLAEKVEDIDRRLCRIEGSLTAKDCCMLKSDYQQKHGS